MDELPQIIIHAGRTSYFTDAVHIDSILGFLRTYPEQIKNLTHHSQVHGPGPIVVFRAVYDLFLLSPSMQALFTSDVLNLNVGYLKDLLLANKMPGNDAAVATSVFMGLFFPLALSLTIIPIYYLGRQYYGKSVALTACGIFAVLPNGILFSPQISQLMTLFACLLCWSFNRLSRNDLLA